MHRSIKHTLMCSWEHHHTVHLLYAWLVTLMRFLPLHTIFLFAPLSPPLPTFLPHTFMCKCTEGMEGYNQTYHWDFPQHPSSISRVCGHSIYIFPYFLNSNLVVSSPFPSTWIHHAPRAKPMYELVEALHRICLHRTHVLRDSRFETSPRAFHSLSLSLQRSSSYVVPLI